MDNLAGGGAHLQEGRAVDKSKSIFSAGLLIGQKSFLSVLTLVLIVCVQYITLTSQPKRRRKYEVSSKRNFCHFLAHSSYLMMRHAKD